MVPPEMIYTSSIISPYQLTGVSIESNPVFMYQSSPFFLMSYGLRRSMGDISTPHIKIRINKESRMETRLS